jgi:hypothetical protein
MRNFTYFSTILTVLGLVYLVFIEEAYAYLDPGTGSYILQLIIAGLLGGLFALKMFWSKVKNFFVNVFSRGNKHEKAED